MYTHGQPAAEGRTVNVDHDAGVQSGDAPSRSPVLSLESRRCQVHVTPTYHRLIVRSVVGKSHVSSGDEYEDGVHQAAAELEVDIVHPHPASVHHQPRPPNDQQALAGLEGEEVREGVGGEAEGRHWLRI